MSQFFAGKDFEEREALLVSRGVKRAESLETIACRAQHTDVKDSGRLFCLMLTGIDPEQDRFL
jgi:hypothetical protein